MPTIVNWRDANPVISHDNAVVWPCMQPVDSDAASSDRGVPASVLRRLDVITVHGIQGRKDSDHHRHSKREQVYYIIKGTGEVVCGDQRLNIREGDALYLPSGLYHQICNPGEDWIVHHVISRDVEEDTGAFVQRNWRDVTPETDSKGAVRWHLLEQKEPENGGTLRGLAWIDREAIQPGGESIERTEAHMEQIYYILGGIGTVILNGTMNHVREGDMIHIPVATPYAFSCTGSDWLTSLIVGG